MTRISRLTDPLIGWSAALIVGVYVVAGELRRTWRDARRVERGAVVSEPITEPEYDDEDGNPFYDEDDHDDDGGDLAYEGD